MCLSDFIKFEQIEEKDALIGPRAWRNPIDSTILKSECQNYIWKSTLEGPHEILKSNSGIYAYNYNYNYYNYNNHNYNNYYYNNNYNYDYYNYYYNYNNNYYNYYYNQGIIMQFGKVAIHKIGQRSEYARIKTLFTIREIDAKGPTEFLDWIKVFNSGVKKIATNFNANTIHWQDFIELNLTERQSR